ncbi:sigma-70 family RNA polymerase sigma factor [Segnochrobactrum spirostomi]|uniref:Sigma-70 family RNA polymerase sigma factor n=1 Tax=Segnochrobactrum spirostomi TaxID=2608987 RepID=A0A6A7Y2X4_9HYPH|nr:sigma-70 family RNA polymerase sigma factor [Segnochrobactrum spirostomi]MQT12628.1 sigma-70 family RNA polymerase sigma factor [Segnochrobactrum spirostomi]
MTGPVPPAASDAAARFEPLRRRLVGLAYRMLGSRAEAEDIVQDAYLRWHGTDREAVEDAGAFLKRVVTRLCLDRLKAARTRRETYVGPWLPEPVLAEDVLIDAGPSGIAHDVGVALMLALERLSPLERAAFLLHDVFELGFDEVARILDRDPSACRQLAVRARDHVAAARPRFTVSESEGRRIADAFLAASRGGDLAALQSMLAADAVLHTDGGGKRSSALNRVFGGDKIARFFAGLARKNRPPSAVRPATINGLPGFVTIEADGVPQTTALEIGPAGITAVYIVRNPDKLGHIR